ncbi:MULTISPECIES: flavodoxin domain-containing protein [Pseudomonas]|uniref:flavodoxin domain-containing protein n=1 Tax=Pseudomonas TaxID=286 RepID=UPI00123A953B|nr:MULTISPECIES: flavodoxin domain-containing protein [Pseudomonas]QIB50994.1 flavodoxin [Pseudomonas sp. OIL-1]
MHLGIISGSVFGTADLVADEAATHCEAAGLQITRIKQPTVDTLVGAAVDALLVVCSTTGMGEIPDSLMPFYVEMQDRFPLLTGVPFGVIALGDAGYGDTFCQGGQQVRELLQELQGREAIAMLELDASETVTPETDALPWLDEFISHLKSA